MQFRSLENRLGLANTNSKNQQEKDQYPKDKLAKMRTKIKRYINTNI